jgi:hypothetical protein
MTTTAQGVGFLAGGGEFGHISLYLGAGKLLRVPAVFAPTQVRPTIL